MPVVIYPPRLITATVNSAGRGVCEFAWSGSTPARVTQIAPEGGTALLNSVGAIRFNGALITPFNPVMDACAQEPFLWVQPGDSLIAEWTSATPGATVKATFLFDLGG